MQILTNMFNCLVWIICRQNGRSYLGMLDHIHGSFSILETPFTDISNVVCS